MPQVMLLEESGLLLNAAGQFITIIVIIIMITIITITILLLSLLLYGIPVLLWSTARDH